MLILPPRYITSNKVNPKQSPFHSHSRPSNPQNLDSFFPEISGSHPRVSVKMFSSSQFDGNSQSSQFPDSTQSPAKYRESHGLLPVTVKQISQASQSGDEKSSFKINGADVTNVTVVGMVSDKDEKVSDIGFIIDDGTGRVACKRWINEPFDKIEADGILEGSYVRINGHLSSFQGTTNLVVFSTRPVTNYDEISFHFIDCIHSHILSSKAKLPRMGESTFTTPVKSEPTNSQASSASQLAKQYTIDGLKDCDQLVIECLKQYADMGQEKGMHIDEICKHLKLPSEKIKESIRAMEDDGLIYSTIDEYHYKAT
ncbi:Replication protein A 32 kDa subunit A [Linum perenne]